ncbi:Uma2 family endonuclease [Calycomorphotria hydatis]|uniref:Putative restriction endonuclease domain-containing protein n=1 Tax=Calycomorphotria hydatis TaxID=2528027 RepID=A0A517TCA7_9PLAN|nr:Uma2 family endonuclease [Calycomorphotria hydatis]QDT66012.1 hypothetical protein V22_32760 [Calycomorphotria hydatis]
MATAVPTSPTVDACENVAELVEQLGNIPLERILMHPLPGTATEEDLLSYDGSDKLVELVDGVLVEKGAMAYLESLLAVYLIEVLSPYVRKNRLGAVSAGDGDMRMVERNVRKPDVGFAIRTKFPDGRVSDDPIADFGPDLAVEILSRSNTPKEMQKKRAEYFASGCRLVWEVNFPKRIVNVYHDVEQFSTLTEEDTLSGEEVIPGFELSIRKWFEEAGRV